MGGETPASPRWGYCRRGASGRQGSPPVVRWDRWPERTPVARSRRILSLPFPRSVGTIHRNALSCGSFPPLAAKGSHRVHYRGFPYIGRRGGMVYAAVSKTAALTGLRVRVPSPAPREIQKINGVRSTEPDAVAVCFAVLTHTLTLKDSVVWPTGAAALPRSILSRGTGISKSQLRAAAW
jgi:hypothetical protein